MTTSLSRDEIVNKQLTLSDAALQEIERAYLNGELGDGYKTVPQCYVCCEKEVRDFVNRQIGAGMTNREIAENCAYINGKRAEAGDTRMISPKVVWNHRRNHFNVHEPAKAFVRGIVERNAERANIDHINGIGHAVTPYAAMETVMAMGFDQVVNEARSISTKELIETSTKFHEMTTKDAGQRKMADLLYRMDRILTAIWNVVPEEYHQEILRVVEGNTKQEPMEKAIEHVHEVAEKAVKEFTPNMTMDEDDQL